MRRACPTSLVPAMPMPSAFDSISSPGQRGRSKAPQRRADQRLPPVRPRCQMIDALRFGALIDLFRPHPLSMIGEPKRPDTRPHFRRSVRRGGGQQPAHNAITDGVRLTGCRPRLSGARYGPKSHTGAAPSGALWRPCYVGLICFLEPATARPCRSRFHVRSGRRLSQRRNCGRTDHG